MHASQLDAAWAYSWQVIPEISDFDPVILGEEKVVGLEVEMQEVAACM